MLDGQFQGMELDVEFGFIAVIARESARAAKVTLRNGRTLVLRGSNDVDRSNRGILIEQESGETVLVNWEAFDRVEFSR